MHAGMVSFVFQKWVHAIQTALICSFVIYCDHFFIIVTISSVSIRKSIASFFNSWKIFCNMDMHNFFNYCITNGQKFASRFLLQWTVLSYISLNKTPYAVGLVYVLKCIAKGQEEHALSTEYIIQSGIPGLMMSLFFFLLYFPKPFQ